MRGTTADPKVSLTLTLFPKSGEESGGFNVDSADDGNVRVIAFPTVRIKPSTAKFDDLGAKAEAAIISLTPQGWVRNNLPDLGSLDSTEKLARIVNALSELATETRLVVRK
jgi:hypothetical protein